MNNLEDEFIFEKKIGIAECVLGNIGLITEITQRLMVCMQETNKKHGVECEFFRMDFRQPYLDEQFQFPLNCFILHIKWGSKKEFEKITNEFTQS